MKKQTTQPKTDSKTNKQAKTSDSTFSQAMIHWYRQHGRKNLPWQLDNSPYHTWLSEVMLQQTQVQTVIPYYLKFTETYPDITSLANAKLDQVLHLWTGLGYYSRARNLHKSAQMISHEFKGQFPKTQAGLEALPGVGRSTAGAILSLSMKTSAAILDGNVKRVLCRFHCIEGWSSSPATQKQLWALAEAYTPKKSCKQYNQSMMDLGATLCKRSKPQCEICPLAPNCEAYARGEQKRFPQPKPKKDIPEKSCNMLLLQNPKGLVYLEQRPPTGIWGSLWSFPEFSSPAKLVTYCERNDIQYQKAATLNDVRHTFTHFKLTIQTQHCQVKKQPAIIRETGKGTWFRLNSDQELGLPSPIKKLIAQVQN